MRTSVKIGAALSALPLLLGVTSAVAVTKSITCYNITTGAARTVKAGTCPKGYAKSKPIRWAYDDIQVSSAWVKAMDTAMPMDGMYMTGAFMHITNLSDKDVTLVGGSATFAKEVQVHEVVAGKMRMKDGGLLIKAGTTEALRPGGNHVMFVFMPGKLLAGDEVSFRLRLADGRVVKVTAPVKATNAGSESYKPQSSM